MKWILSLLFIALPSTCLANVPSSWAESRVRHYASHYGVPPELIAALIDVESGWNPNAISKLNPTGERAMGMMQLMPKTAKRFGATQPFDADQNIAAGTRYVTTLMWEFHGDLRLVAAAYYAGDHWVGQKQLAYRNPDVIAYVQAVRRRYMMRKFAAAIPPRR
jgi:soluble lytic murein transglycosylase